MDGLFAAASVVGVVSLAVQLGDSIKKLRDFWDPVKEAPDHVHAITTGLSLLSSVLTEIAFEEQHCGPDYTLTRVLEACRGRVNKLPNIINDMEPGFASTSLRMRKWTAFKAVLKGERI